LNDIIFYPHLYDIHWARDLNRFLSGKFTTLLEPQYAPWLKSRSLNHAYMAQLLPLLRQRPQSRLLLANAVDYSPDFAQYGYVSEIYAFVHSRHILGSPKAGFIIDKSFIKVGEIHERPFFNKEVIGNDPNTEFI